MNAKTAIAAVAALLLLSGTAYAFDLPFGVGEKAAQGNRYAAAQTNGDWTPGYGMMGPRSPWLTEEQRTTLQEKRAELLEEGASWEETREEMHELREELGITGPNFVDEDGDGVCDHAGTGGYKHAAGSGRGHGRWR